MKKGCIVTLIGLAAMFLGGCSKTSSVNGTGDPATEISWTVRTIGLDSAVINSFFYYDAQLIWENNQFFIVNRGITITSADGKSWVQHTSNLPQYPCGLAWGAGKFIAVMYSSGYGGDMYSSPDGINWSKITVPGGVGCFSVARGSDKFVALGTVMDTDASGNTTSMTNYALTSTDGISWASNAIAGEYQLTTVVYVNNKYIVTSNNNDNMILTSTNGLQWAVDSSNPTGYSLTSIAFGANRYVAAANAGRSAFAGSADGITWTQDMLCGLTNAAVIWNGSRFVAAGGANVLISSDGINWSFQPGIGPVTQMIQGKNGTIVALGYGEILTSP